VVADAEKWNGKFLGVGNGGFGGAVPIGDMRRAPSRKATQPQGRLGSPTDFPGCRRTWVIGHPEKLKDFAYRADHVTPNSPRP